MQLQTGKNRPLANGQRRVSDYALCQTTPVVLTVVIAIAESCGTRLQTRRVCQVVVLSRSWAVFCPARRRLDRPVHRRLVWRSQRTNRLPHICTHSVFCKPVQLAVVLCRRWLSSSKRKPQSMRSEVPAAATAAHLAESSLTYPQHSSTVEPPPLTTVSATMSATNRRHIIANTIASKDVRLSWLSLSVIC